MTGEISAMGRFAARAMGDDRIGLAVTGLSRAGKTVFVTSLIQNLLALGQGLNTLPAFAACLRGDGEESRLLGVEIMPTGASALPHFDQPAKLAALAGQGTGQGIGQGTGQGIEQGDRPAWPDRTEDLATISLLLTIARSSGLGRRIGPRRVRLDILDYPGEWLLDLPLLDQDFATWSAATLALMRAPPRAALAAPFLGFLERHRGGGPADEALARQGHVLYRAALERGRAERGLRFLQPGRFLCPGPRGDVPLMWFYPDDSPRPGGGMAGLLEQRFEAYKTMVRTEFFAPHFAAFHRQVMLVDVLGALVGGKAAYEDTARAVQAIAGALRYGASAGMVPQAASWMLRGMGQVLPPVLGRVTEAAARQMTDPRIERVGFVATKADHVPAMKRDNLLHLLRALVDPVAAAQGRDGARVGYHVAASLLATEDGVERLEGRSIPVVRGIVMGETRVRPYFVGEVPAGPPPEGFWSDAFFELPTFRPPPVDASGRTGLPHLGLDVILADLIGDLVQ
jgi:predicted YcjX-like family ATPase